MIIYQRVQFHDGKLIIVIPDEDAEKSGVKEGDQVAISFERIDEATMSPEVREAFEASWKRSEAAYRRLSGR